MVLQFQFELDENLAESLSNLQRLESEADDLSQKLDTLEAVDSNNIAAMLSQLEQLKVSFQYIEHIVVIFFRKMFIVRGLC